MTQPGPAAMTAIHQRLRALLGLRRHEAQVVDLLADLGDQRQRDAGARAERDEAERRVAAVDAAVVRPLLVRARVLDRDDDERQEHADEPQRLRPHLHLRQQRHAEDDQRRDHQRRDAVAEPQRDAEPEVQALGHDRPFEGEEDEREARVDQ